jgi:pyridoxine 5'-phosphate synthase PdxJ
MIICAWGISEDEHVYKHSCEVTVFADNETDAIKKAKTLVPDRTYYHTRYCVGMDSTITDKLDTISEQLQKMSDEKTNP